MERADWDWDWVLGEGWKVFTRLWGERLGRNLGALRETEVVNKGYWGSFSVTQRPGLVREGGNLAPT